MKDSARYVKIVEWSEEDHCYVGSAPGLIYGGCHGDDEKLVFNDLCRVVEDAIELYRIVTGRMLDVLGGGGRRAMLNEVKRYELFANGRVAPVSLGRPDLVIDRSVLAGELCKLAEGAGARVVPGRRFLGLRALLRAGLSRSAPATGESRPTVP